MSEHTPGPWREERDNSKLVGHSTIIGKNDLIVAEVILSADARLMVRAPEMEKLLRQLVRILDAADGNLPLYSQQGQGMDGISERENYRDIAQKARSLLNELR